MAEERPTNDRMLHKRDVETMTGLSYTTIWRRIRRGNFPAGRQFGPQCVRWAESEVRAWLERQPRQSFAGTRRRHKRVREDR